MNERLEESARALATLDAALAIRHPNEIERDAALMRFAYTFESIWKTARLYLSEIHHIDAGTQRDTIRACGEANTLTPEQTRAALSMASDRNLLVHTYREALANHIQSRLHGHAALLRLWLDALAEAARTA